MNQRHKIKSLTENLLSVYLRLGLKGFEPIQ